MTLALIAARGTRSTGNAPPTPPSEVWEPGVPYAIPQSPPYNVPVFAVTPTPDGTGSALHPDVIDFGAEGWNNYRYWMGYTPYVNNDSSVENPCIGVSHDGFTWTPPPGLTNPLDPTPARGWNADTDLVYADGVLHLFWRDWNLSQGRMMMRTTTDGVNWTPKVNCLTGTPGDNLTSLAVVFDGTTWHMWNQSINATQRIFYRTAPTPTGPWSSPTSVTIYSETEITPWHLDVILHDGRYWMVLYINAARGPLRVASSTDGVTWFASEPVMTPTTGWQGALLYRATIQPHENGTHMRMWYSGSGSSSNRIAYTHIAKDEWPNPGPLAAPPSEAAEPLVTVEGATVTLEDVTA